MESLSKSILLLAAYHFLFFWKWYRNPYLLSTSEIASTYFPFWRHTGRKLRSGAFPALDDIYYKLPASIPFLSMFYPPNLVSAWLGSFIKDDDKAFRLYAYSIFGHHLLCSLFAFFVFREWCEPVVALFGAITLAYSGYVFKVQTPSFVYSMAWVPAIFIPNLGPVAFGMAILGGYWPILVYLLPWIALVKPVEALLGIFIAIPQIIPFIGYYKASVRYQAESDESFGKCSLKAIMGLFWPLRSYNQTNGVHYPEMSCYMGLACLFILGSGSRFWFVLFFSMLIALGKLPAIQRIPARALYAITFSIAVLSTDGLHNLGLSYSYQIRILLLQGFLLFRNADIYPSFPFSQWWDKPSKLYQISRKKNEWPYFSGYFQGRKNGDYKGAFALRDKLITD